MRGLVDHEQIRRQHVVRGIADPGQVLHLVGDEQAVGTGPDPAVGNDLVQVECQNPRRHRREQHQHKELERIRSQAASSGSSALKVWPCGDIERGFAWRGERHVRGGYFVVSAKREGARLPCLGTYLQRTIMGLM